MTEENGKAARMHGTQCKWQVPRAKGGAESKP